jgi:hypothetical protein
MSVLFIIATHLYGNGLSEDDALLSKRVIMISNTDILFVLTVFYSFIILVTLWDK